MKSVCMPVVGIRCNNLSLQLKIVYDCSVNRGSRVVYRNQQLVRGSWQYYRPAVGSCTTESTSIHLA